MFKKIIKKQPLFPSNHWLRHCPHCPWSATTSQARYFDRGQYFQIKPESYWLLRKIEQTLQIFVFTVKTSMFYFFLFFYLV